MSLDFWYRKNYFTGSAMMRHCSEWVLCVLLLVLGVSAKIARYEIQKPTLKLATTQAYLDGEETLRKLPKTALPCSGMPRRQRFLFFLYHERLCAAPSIRFHLHSRDLIPSPISALRPFRSFSTRPSGLHQRR